MFSSFEEHPPQCRKIIFKKKKKNLFDKNSSLNHEDASWEEKGRAFFGRRQIRRRETKETEREREKEEERERRFRVFFFRDAGEVKKGARLNV